MGQRSRSIREAKAEKARQKRRAKRRKRALFLFSEILIFCILLSVGYVMTKYGKLQLNILEKNDVVINEGVKQQGYTTIALFGGDSREGQLEAGTHADTIIIASIDNDTKEVKLASVYRDTMTAQEDGTIKKANNGYFVGGPAGAINMLNRNLDLDISQYVTVDFKALADVIDLLDGIDVEVSAEEAVAMNQYIGETAKVTKKQSKNVSAGLQTLDGVQAVTYARIRKNVGGDYARTDRQRLVIQKVAEKAKKMNPLQLNEIIDTVFTQISTSFTLPQIVKYAGDILKYHIGETTGFPFERTDGYVDGIGSVVVPLGFVENVEELHAFLYPKDEYTVSANVQEIATQIETLSGYTRQDYVDPNGTDS